MIRTQLSLPLYLPRGLYRLLRGLRRRLRPAVQPAALAANLLGDRDIEWSWVAARIPEGPGEALDFGNGGSILGLIAAQRGFRVTAIDLGAVRWPYEHPGLVFTRGDLLSMPLGERRYDLVINCSTVEHVGLAGRYDVAEQRDDGDLEAMARLAALMRPGARMILTVPVGLDAVFAPFCRIYGAERLPRLLAGFHVREELYWRKGDRNQWAPCDRAAALATVAAAGSSDPLACVYALGCLVLELGAP